MATTIFKDTTYSVFGLMEDIKPGEVALPDLQRPFVWEASKVRDLFDSMYKGFPVGYLLFWQTGAEAGARQIGVDAKQKVPRLLIVDGQQRLTSLYAVITGAGSSRTTTRRAHPDRIPTGRCDVRGHRRGDRERPRVHRRHLRPVGAR